MALVVNRPNFQLKATLVPQNSAWSLELHQHWPEALNPHWRRITQLNLTNEELDRLADLLKRRDQT